MCFSFQLSQKTVDFWDETEPFGQTGGPSPDLRLPSHIVPSYYRLKLKTDLENATFSGDVFITIRASRQAREIILHAKSLSINSNAKLTEQIYEKVETLHAKVKRDVSDVNVTVPENVPTEIPTTALSNETNSTVTEVPNIGNVTDSNVTTQAPTATTSEPPLKPIDTEVTHSAVRTIKILSIKEGTGDRIIIMLESPMKSNVDYILQLSFDGVISNSLTGFYKSTYKNSQGEVK